MQTIYIILFFTWWTSAISSCALFLKSLYRLLHPRECDIQYTRTEPEGHRPKGEVHVYWILHEQGCNNVFISAEAILRMRTTCYCAMLLYYFEITMRLKQAPVNVERWSERRSSCYTALLSLKKTAKLPKRILPLSPKKSCFTDLPTEMLASLACYSMPENSARNSKYHCNASSSHYTRC